MTTPRRFNFMGIAAIVLLFGCVGASKTRLSQPQMEGTAERFQKGVGEMYVLPSVDLHVEPANSKSKTLMVFPIPIYEGERKSVAQTFLFFVSIISKRAGQTLIPQDFAYLSSAGDRFEPASMVGPYDCSSQEPRPAAVRAPLQPFYLAEGSCYTMLVRFDAPPPDPSENFRFAPGTLKSEGGSEALPVIRFSESTRGNTVAIP